MTQNIYENRVLEINISDSSFKVGPYLQNDVVDFDSSQLRTAFYTAIVITIAIQTDKTLLATTIRQIYSALHRNGGLVIRSMNGALPSYITDLLTGARFKEIITSDEQNKHVLTALKHRDPHTHDLPMSAHEFETRLTNFKSLHLPVTPISFIVTVHNEALNLPVLLSFLENISNQTGAQREFIFVLNNCTDDSKLILDRYLTGSSVHATITQESIPGIVPAFRKGIESRTLDGLVGRFDADIILDPYTLDLMYMHLMSDPAIKVTYAEPKALDSRTAFNQPWYEPSILSKRLYYTGKTSLYRSSPFEDPFLAERPDTIIADDVLTSFYFAFTFGLDSISRTPHALVYEKVAGTIDDLTSQLSRISSEISRIFKTFPQFAILGDITNQVIYESEYKKLVDEATKNVKYTDDWLRLESTK